MRTYSADSETVNVQVTVTDTSHGKDNNAEVKRSVLSFPQGTTDDTIIHQTLNELQYNDRNFRKEIVEDDILLYPHGESIVITISFSY